MIQLTVAPQVLTWDAGANVLRRSIEKEFEVLLYESLRRAGGEEYASATPHEGVRLAMTAPRTARVLLWPRTSPPTRTRRFLERAFSAERAVMGVDDDRGFSGWTADYRARVRPNGEVAWQPLLSRTLTPLDLRSPHARSLDLLGGSRVVCPPRAVPADDVTQAAVARVEEAWRGIRATPGSVADCMVAWTRVVVVQSDRSGLFWSGSNGQYIGRVMLVNPHLQQTSVEEIADALVHEAIHGFLSMHERVEPWVHNTSLYTDAAAVVSPWSGNPLPVRQFLQACFVWYGLTMFWGEHLDGAVFDQATAQRMLMRALRGFCGQSFADVLWPWRDQVRAELIPLITDMQRSVRWLLE
jgi:HEXXH motif-containing protein